MTVTAQFDSVVVHFAEVIAAAEPALTALDEASGDGDFGSNLNEGLHRVTARIDAGGAPWASLHEVFLDEVGGTSGPLFGLMFQALGRAAREADTFAAALAEGLSEALAAIQRVGEAEVGDRTLVDALAPAVASLRESTDDVTAMVTAAVDGALGTAQIRARRGRSSYVGDRALGHPDPGAVGVALFLTVLAEPVTGASAATTERTRLFDN
jgi:phosphoenolpyruvate---glycerone phosphotransferase subunit DhaL